MKENDFLNRYRNWSDDELINAFNKRIDYQPAAVEAMKIILKERNLYDTIIYTVEQDQRKAQYNKEQLIEDFEVKSSGSDETDFVFAQKCLKENGTFYEGVFAMQSKYYQWVHVISILLIGIGGASFLMFCIGLSVGQEMFKNAQIIFGSGTILFATGIVFYALNIQNAKTVGRLYKNQDNITFELKNRKFFFTTNIPCSFSVSFTYQITQIRTESNAGLFNAKIKNPLILLLLSNPKGDSVVLEEILPAWAKFPGEIIDPDLIAKSKKAMIFSPYPFGKPRLMALRKIMKGLAA